MDEQERKILRWAIDFFFNLKNNEERNKALIIQNDVNNVDEEREDDIVGL